MKLFSRTRLMLCPLFIVGFCLFATASLNAQPAAPKTSAPFRRIVVSSVKPTIQTGAVIGYGPTREDFRRIQKLEGIKNQTPVREVAQDVWVGGEPAKALLIGTTPSYVALHANSLERGRFLSEKDVRQLNNVAVLGDRLAEALFPQQNPLGKNVRIGRTYYLIVGIATDGLHHAETREHPLNEQSPLYIPISTMRSRMGDRTMTTVSGNLVFERYELSRIELEVPAAQANKIAKAIQELLNQADQETKARVQILKNSPSENENSQAVPNRRK